MRLCSKQGTALPINCIGGKIHGQADVAQLGEQLIRNQSVRGSSPLIGLVFYPMHFGLL